GSSLTNQNLPTPMKAKKEYKPVDLAKIKTYSISERKTKAAIDHFAKTSKKGTTFKQFYDSLPNFLGAKNLKRVVEAIVSANKNNRPVILGMGAHVIKVGLSPIIIDMLEKGIIDCLVLNGAGAIHDFEVATQGRTSEDVEVGLKSGMFGMVTETLQTLNQIDDKFGLGRAVGNKILELKASKEKLSLLATAAKLNIPATVQVAFGTDTIHMSPDFKPEIIGAATHNDFKLLCSVIADLEGGVYINLGSAVILPEVFLKALTVARNLGNRVENFTTVNMDMLQHYRPHQNVLKRPGGASYALTGHHEIMLPLLYQALLDYSS
ncbi:hypothetical protein ACFL52_05115, partial [Candidatus Margulisiibacteriota bacterium]